MASPESQDIPVNNLAPFSGEDRTARRVRRPWLLLSGAVSIVVALALLVPKQPASLRPDEKVVARLRFTPVGAEGNAADRQTHDKIITSQVISAALSRADVQQLDVLRNQPDPKSWLRDSLVIEPDLSAHEVAISLTGAEPQQLASLVNAVAQAAVQEAVEEQSKQRTEQLTEQTSRSERALADVRAAHAVVQRLAASLQIPDPNRIEERARAAQQELSESTSKHAQVLAQLATAEQRLEAHRSREVEAKRPPVSEAALAEALEADEVYTAQAQRVRRLQERLRQYEELFVDPQSEPSWIAVSQRLEELRPALEARRAEIRDQFVDHLRQSAPAASTTTLKTLQTEVTRLLNQEKNVREHKGHVQAETEQLAKAVEQLKVAQAAVTRAEALAQQLSTELNALQTAALPAAPFRVEQEAVASTAPPRNSNRLTRLGTATVALCIGCGLVYLGIWGKRRQPVYGQQPRQYATPAQTDRWLPRPGGSSEFDVIGELGGGSSCIVYKARQRLLNRFVALKVIVPDGRLGSEEEADIRAFVQTVARIRHPHILQIYALTRMDSRPCLVTELAEGGSLAEQLLSGPFEPHEAARLVEILARAIDSAHRAGVYHGDLKSSHILLMADGSPKIADFSLECWRDTTRNSVPGHLQTVYDAGRRAADIAALGAILNELLTGGALGQAAQQRAGTAPRHGIPRELHQIYRRCLDSDYGYTDAGELAADLQHYLVDEPIPTAPPRLAAGTPEPRSRRSASDRPASGWQPPDGRV